MEEQKVNAKNRASRFVGVALVAFIMIASGLGVYLYGEKTSRDGSSAGESKSNAPSDADIRVEVQKIAASFQVFARLPIGSDYPEELVELHRLLNSNKPVAILFWPSDCEACSTYKYEVWDVVKTQFKNITFADYVLNSPEGERIASIFGLTGITIVMSYNGTIAAVIYGEHIPAPDLASILRVLSSLPEGGAHP